MKTVPESTVRGQCHRPGISLVVVISLMGLLSVLAVSLLAMVTSNRQTNHLEAESRKSEMLARSAFNALLADLTDEMKSGSASVTETKMKDGTLFRRYDCTGKPAGMTVTRAVKSQTFAETCLVKQSASGVPFHSQGGQPSQRASAESTTAGIDPLSPSIWAKPRLLPSSVALGTDTTPDWIYVSRDGSNPVTYKSELKQREISGEPNPKFVIGRYAYNLYDTSGLMDLNAAGHPAAQPEAGRVGAKGTLALADLTALTGMSAQGVSDLSAWKHDWSGDATKLEDYLRLSEGSGWKVLAANDNLFLSRQDLLHFARLRPEVLPDDVVPMLTHFSRDLDAPSFRPHPNRPKVARKGEQGGNDAYGQDDTLNPDLSAYDEKRDRQLLPRRFPLERLKWVATPGSGGPVSPEKAEKYFGLKWNGTAWDYVHARPDGRMYTLQDIPEGREANFFEILRASVLVGSLGRQFAARGWDDLDQKLSMHQLPTAGGIGGIDASINLNIMELGACLIDQYDSDSYPTDIVISGGSRPYSVFGKEDVPYINRLSAIPYRGKSLRIKVYKKDGTAANTECYEAAMVLQPALWRPHQVVEDYNGPTNFRIRPRHIDQAGGSMFYMTRGWAVPGRGAQPAPDRSTAGDYTYWGGPNYRATESSYFPKTFTGADYLDVTVAHSSTAFREPQSVHSPAHGAIAGYSVGGTAQPVTVRSADLRWEGLPTSFTQVSGFLVGHALTARIEPGAAGDDRLQVGYFRGDPIEVQMEYEGPDGNWHPYQNAEFTYKSNWAHHYLVADPDWQTEAFYWSSYLVDPRTARFGGLATILAGGVKTKSWTTLDPQMTWPEGASLAFGSQRGEGVRPGWTVPAANTGWNFNGDASYVAPYNPGGIAENNKVAWSEGNTFAYKDPDDVRRPGAAALNDYGSGTTGNPMLRRGSISTTGKLNVSSSALAGRPRILNRPFRSVAELAYSFRGTPWRDIDFLNPSSPAIQYR